MHERVFTMLSMPSLMFVSLAFVVLFSVSCFADEAPPAPKSALDFKVKDIDENEVDLVKYKGKAVLIVNVASKCGFTSQYESLQAIYEEYKDKGLVILGFPANNFLRQEPGTNFEIKSFCTLNYNVTFDMFAKISVKGKDIAPLYAFLTSRDTNPGFGGSIKWNFTKFLLDREGNVAARFGVTTKPDSDKVIKALQTALASKPAEEGS